MRTSCSMNKGGKMPNTNNNDDEYFKPSLNNKVTKSNLLIRSNYKLTLQEQRLLSFAISLLDSRKPNGYADIAGRTKVITAKEFCTVFKIDNKNIYKVLQDSTEKLFDRKVTIKNDVEHTVQTIRWASSAIYDEKRGQVVITFSEEIMPYLILMRNRFTSYSIKNIAGMKKQPSIHLYELLIEAKNQNKRWVDFALSDLKERLELNGSYNRFSNLKARILDPAKVEINKYSDIDVAWTALREKRKVVSIRFDLTGQVQKVLPL